MLQFLFSTLFFFASFYREGDALQIPWRDAQLVFFSSYCFDDDLLHSLFDRATLLRPGALILTFKLPTSNTMNSSRSAAFPASNMPSYSNVHNWESLFSVRGQYEARFSWGRNRVWLLEKRA